MTFIEIIVFVVNAVFGGMLGAYFYGISGSLMLAAVGIPLGFFCGVAFFLFLRKAADKWYQVYPLRPSCEKGKCSSDDYDWDAKASGFLKGDVFECKCHDRYIEKGRLFDKLLPDGTRQPYMKRRLLLRRWYGNAQ